MAVHFAIALLMLSSPVRLLGIAGLEGTFEFGLDAPWRIEPSKKADGTIDYGAIPIQITIHGAMDAGLDDIMYLGPSPIAPSSGKVPIRLPQNLLSLGKFSSVRITELRPDGSPLGVATYEPKALFEIERTTGAWPWPSRSRDAPFHELCRVWAGNDPEPFRDISHSSEWHATLWYVPVNKAPRTTVPLRIEVVLKRSAWPDVKTPIGAKVNIDVSPSITLRNYVRVYLASDPLPRFDKRWLYGDFHYHSQGTDNEGEAGYNYRGVIRAMGAMGLDFLFATDHASSSEQVIDADLPPVYRIPEIAHSQGDKLEEKNAKSTGGVLRDMDSDRFAFCHGLIYDNKGVNGEASSKGFELGFPQNYKSYGVVPQLFLGGELDAIGEVKKATVLTEPQARNPSIPYGNGLNYFLGNLCSPVGCDNANRLLSYGDQDSFLVSDFQSLEEFLYFGRQHLVYFPNSARLRVGNETSFIASNTSRFGGATRRLNAPFIVQPGSANQLATDPLLPEVERKGVVFVAHHLNAGSGRGPDGIPWTTDHMLLMALRSPAVLGLEFWNEDTRFRTRVCSHDFCRNNADGSHYGGYELGYERNEKLEAGSDNPFEQLVISIVKGLGGDMLPKDYHNIALPLEEVRHGFITGGANGSQFELQAFEPRNGFWQERVYETEYTLHHGAYDWDVMNLRGLDFEQNTNLSWLKPGEPRRMFMGGGSDAHGDLNYRRAGYFLGTDDANDTAIGKPRNLVFVGDPDGAVVTRPVDVVAPIAAASGTAAPRTGLHSLIARWLGGQRGAAGQPPKPTPPELAPIGGVRAHSQEQIISALRRGRFCVTDGPALRIAVDRNGNNKIDDDDIQMGDILSLKKPLPLAGGPAGGQTITLLTEVISTPEFGPVYDVDIYVGAQPSRRPASSTVPVESRMYAPSVHGPYHEGNRPQIHYVSQGRTYSRLKQNYWDGERLDASVKWKHTPGSSLRYAHTQVTTLHLDYYQVGEGITADRFFVRAFTRTGHRANSTNHQSDSADHYAFSNPIWIIRTAPQIPEVPIDNG